MALVGKLCAQIGGLTFIKGGPMNIPSRTGPVILELWASWCGPCRKAFPHLSQLQRKYKAQGLTVVGVCLEEDGPQTRAFVAQQGANMDYVVAVDSGGQAGALLSSARVSGIPHAFIIDAKGIIRHHGHPMEPKFASVLDTVCKEPPPAAAAAGEPAGAPTGSAAAAAAPEQPKPQRQLPPVTQSREELMGRPVRELKQILQERGIRFEDLNEKGELVDRILERCSRVTYYA